MAIENDILFTLFLKIFTFAFIKTAKPPLTPPIGFPSGPWNGFNKPNLLSKILQEVIVVRYSHFSRVYLLEGYIFQTSLSAPYRGLTTKKSQISQSSRLRLFKRSRIKGHSRSIEVKNLKMRKKEAPDLSYSKFCIDFNKKFHEKKFSNS